jgi:type IV pilus assembly protein PilV
MIIRTSGQNLADSKKWSHGFTLMEVLIAIVILSVGLLGMAALTVGIINGNKFSNDVTKATTLAKDKMEDVIRSGYSGPPQTETPVIDNYGTILPDYGEYERITVADLYTSGTDWPPDGIKVVTVTVNWKDSNQSVHFVEVKTILAQ